MSDQWQGAEIYWAAPQDRGDWDRLLPVMGTYAQALHRYWQDIHPEPGRLPGREHLSPKGLHQTRIGLLPHIWLSDVVRADGALRFQYRLIGTSVVRAGMLARVGSYVDEFGDQSRERSLQKSFESMVAYGSPSYRRGAPQLPQHPEVIEIERVSLPLASDGRNVDMIISATTYSWQDGFPSVSR